MRAESQIFPAGNGSAVTGPAGTWDEKETFVLGLIVTFQQHRAPISGKPGERDFFKSGFTLVMSQWLQKGN